jgi:hypothetical protein
MSRSTFQRMTSRLHWWACFSPPEKKLAFFQHLARLSTLIFVVFRSLTLLQVTFTCKQKQAIKIIPWLKKTVVVNDLHKAKAPMNCATSYAQCYLTSVSISVGQALTGYKPKHQFQLKICIGYFPLKAEDNRFPPALNNKECNSNAYFSGLFV